MIKAVATAMRGGMEEEEKQRNRLLIWNYVKKAVRILRILMTQIEL